MKINGPSIYWHICGINSCTGVLITLFVNHLTAAVHWVFRSCDGKLALKLLIAIHEKCHAKPPYKKIFTVALINLEFDSAALKDIRSCPSCPAFAQEYEIVWMCTRRLMTSDPSEVQHTRVGLICVTWVKIESWLVAYCISIRLVWHWWRI